MEITFSRQRSYLQNSCDGILDEDDLIIKDKPVKNTELKEIRFFIAYIKKYIQIGLFLLSRKDARPILEKTRVEGLDVLAAGKS